MMQKTNVLILAAGIGSRLQPFTLHTPKALVKIGRFTMLEMALKKMERLKVEKVVINVHHFADQIIDFLKDYRSDSDMEIIISDEREKLLDTGGALMNAHMYFTIDEPILIYNVDVLTNASLEDFMDFHIKNENLVSLMVQNREASRYLLFDDKKLLCGWENPATGEIIELSKKKDLSRLGFNGVQIVDYEALSLIENNGVFPIIPEYLKLSKSYPVKGWEQWEGKWFDIGDPQKLERAKQYFESLSDKEQNTFY